MQHALIGPMPSFMPWSLEKSSSFSPFGWPLGDMIGFDKEQIR